MNKKDAKKLKEFMRKEMSKDEIERVQRLKESLQKEVKKQ